jgi:hypothetical protein
MIVVTGMARTGTSNMMKTLVEMGYKTPAPKFLSLHEPIKDRNPEGFYELDEEIRNGVHDSRYRGMAIKLFPPQLYLTHPKYVTKAIICKRNREDCVESYRSIHKILDEPATPEAVYDANIFLLEELKENMDYIEVDLEEQKSPAELKTKLINFLCHY